MLGIRPGSGQPDRDRGLGRLEAFSDGVFSVAITLLVLDIRAPRVGSGLLVALTGQWPAYLGYAISFIVIGIWWANHHDLFDHFRRTDHVLMLLNTLFLMCIGFLPYSTALVIDYLRTPREEGGVAAGVYVTTLLLAAIAYNVIWRYGVRARLLRRAYPPAYVYRRNRVSLYSMFIYALALLVAYFSISATMAICFLVAVYYAVPARWRPTHPADVAAIESGWHGEGADLPRSGG